MLALALGSALASPTPVEKDLEAAKRDILSDIGDLLNIVQHVYVFITLDTLTTNIASVIVTVKNDLLVPLHIEKMSSKAGINGTVYAEFDATFKKGEFTVQPFGKTANSTLIPNVLLTQGALNSLELIELGKIDIQRADIDLRVIGIPIPNFPYAQTNVPTTYELTLA